VEYGRQFEKLLLVVRDDFLPRMQAAPDADAATVTRLRAFIAAREHHTPPAARTLPQSDASSMLRDVT
jgi:hypothetical protein